MGAYRMSVTGRRIALQVMLVATVAIVAGASSCPLNPGLTNPGNYNNTTDPTNGGASLVGKAACSACHPAIADQVALHAHSAISCEDCHGPGSNHLPNPYARANFVDLTGAQSCGNCHGKPPDADAGDIRARDGFIDQMQQWVELRASGGHASFLCGYCHDPHASTLNDRPNGLRNECTACHGDQNMALHKGIVFTRGDYVEPLTCESCHMPFAVLASAPAAPDVVGPLAHIGDKRAHIFRISDVQADFNAFLSDDKSKVKLDSEGRAAMTADMVCLRCHNAVSLPTLAFTPQRAGEFAGFVHLDTVLNQKRIRELLTRPQ
ncbi:MAG: hypothetical protein AABZ08_01025 [Planctomycetota bacterium]